MLSCTVSASSSSATALLGMQGCSQGNQFLQIQLTHAAEDRRQHIEAFYRGSKISLDTRRHFPDLRLSVCGCLCGGLSSSGGLPSCGQPSWRSFVAETAHGQGHGEGTSWMAATVQQKSKAGGWRDGLAVPRIESCPFCSHSWHLWSQVQLASGGIEASALACGLRRS